MDRYFVMYDHSLDEAVVQTSASVDNSVTWVVASYTDLVKAMDIANIINSGKLDIFEVPGPWHGVANIYDFTLEEEMI